MATESTEFGTGKTLIVLAVVIGCFAVLWPKIFYPAYQDTSPTSKKHEGKPVCVPCAIKFEEEKRLQFHYELCNLIVKNDKEYRHKPRPASLMFRQCRETVLQACHLELDDTTVQNLQKSIEENITISGTANLTSCLLAEFSIDGHHIALALHKKNASTTKHIHQERPPHLRPEMMHPALREKGQNIPPRMRTIERDARPGPMPGMRPTIGGPGHVVQSNKQASTMSIVMPIYTLVIVLFFIYTITKVLFKKNQDSTPKVMDFHMDPEQRKFVFSEEYSDADPYSMKNYLKKQERDQKRQETEKENSKIVIDAIEGIVKEIDEYKAQKAEEDKKEPHVLSSSPVERVEGETEDNEDETVALSRDQTQQVTQDAKEEVEAEEVVIVNNLIQENTTVKDQPVCENILVEKPVCEDILVEEAVCEGILVEKPVCEDIPVEEPVSEDIPVEEPVCKNIPVEEPVCKDIPAEEIVCKDVSVEKPICEDIAVKEHFSEDTDAGENTTLVQPMFEEALIKESVYKEAENIEGPPKEKTVCEEICIQDSVCQKTDEEHPVCEEKSVFEEMKENDMREVSSTESILKEAPSSKDNTDSITETIIESFKSDSITDTVEDVEVNKDVIAEDALAEVGQSLQTPDRGGMSDKIEVRPKESSQVIVDVSKDVQTKAEHIPEERVDETTPTPGGGEYEEMEVVVKPRELEVVDDGSILSYILDGSVASDMQLLVSEAQCEALSLEECHLNDPTSDYADISDPVVISGKMTISFIEGTTLSSLSELPDLSLDASRGLAADEDSSMYAELPLDEPTTKESTPEEEVLADIARQIEELENAMKEVQEAAGVLKEEVEAKDSEAETKSATEDEEEEVSEYKSVRVEEEVSTAEDYVSTAHQASRLPKDGTDQSRAPPNQTQSLHKTDHIILHQDEELTPVEKQQLEESTPKEEETIDKEQLTTNEPMSSDLPEILPEIPEADKELDEQLVSQQEECYSQANELSETDSNNPVLSVLNIDQEEIPEDRPVGSVTEPTEEDEFVLYPDTLSEEAREYVRQLSADTIKEAVNEAQRIVDQMSEENSEPLQNEDQKTDQMPEGDRQTDSDHPVLSVQYIDQELMDQIPEDDKLSQTDSDHPVLSVQYVDPKLSDQIPEDDKLSQTDSENPVLSVQYIDLELLNQMSEDDKLSQTDSDHPVLSMQYVDHELSYQIPEDDKLSQTDSDHPVLSVQYVDQELLDQIPEDDKLSQTDSENPVLSVQYVDQELLDQIPEDDKLSQTDSDLPVLSVQYVDQELLDQMPEDDKLSQTDSEHPVLSIQYVELELLNKVSEEDKLSQTDSENPVLSVQYVDQDLMDQILEEDKLSQTDSENPILSVQYVDQDLMDQIPEEDKLSQTDSEYPILSVQYVDQDLMDQIHEEDKLSQTDSENPILSVQCVDQDLMDQIPEEDKLSQTDSENPVLSVEYVDQETFDQISKEDKISQCDSEHPVGGVNDSLDENIFKQKETTCEIKQMEEDEFVLYPDTLSNDAKVYVEDVAAFTVKSAIAEAQRLVSALTTEDQAVEEALAEAMREERSPSPTDMVEFYYPSRSGTPVDAAAVIVHDAAPQSAVVRPQQVTDLKHKAFDSPTEQPEEKSTSPSEQSSFEMVGSNGGSTSSYENVSKNDEEEEKEEGEVKTEL